MEGRISIDPQVHFGKPCVTGTRIPVRNVMELVEHGISFSEICSVYYSEIEPDDVKACIHFALEMLDCEELHVAVAGK